VDVFDLRNSLIRDYSAYTNSFIQVEDPSIRDYVRAKLEGGFLWPEPLIQLNPAFEPGNWIDKLVDEAVLHTECRNIFRKEKSPEDREGRPLRLHRHQEDAIRIARDRHNYVLTTGTGSGKSLAYIVPIVDSVLRQGTGKGIQAIIVYPMNALANSQLGELEKFINIGYPNNKGLVTFRRYTGQERDEEREEITANPPDILLTNYVMLEYILTRPMERRTLVQAAQGLRFLVLDELHTYRGRQGADVALLVRRVRDALDAQDMQCVGTSATLAGPGSYEEQQREVAGVGSAIFGAEVRPEHIIGETLQRATRSYSGEDPSFISALRERLEAKVSEPREYVEFIKDPLASWIEDTFGIKADPSGRLIRSEPKTITGSGGAAEQLASFTSASPDRCAAVIRETLMEGFQVKHPDTGFPVFAFRLHQFISRGDTVYASLEPGSDRHITVYGQKTVPNAPDKLLFPVAFCRQCGQDYYVVSKERGEEGIGYRYRPRRLTARLTDEEQEAGFIYYNSEKPWPQEHEEVLALLPEDWVEERGGMRRVRKDRRKYSPEKTRINAAGDEAGDGLDCVYLRAPFRFCLNCGVAYGFRQTSDFAKLAELGSEGRSTATTILSLGTILNLRTVDGLEARARKLLSFTDNRQDASLQSGHFNDFIEIGLIRAAIYKAVHAAGTDGLEHDQLADEVFKAIGLPKEYYASDPEVRYQAEKDTERAFRDVLAYRVYRDLKRGWRIVAPNLEQCGLLEIQYVSLPELCQDEPLWSNTHPALQSATQEARQTVAKVLLDYMRRELAIKVDYLDPFYQDRLRQRSNQRLRLPWAIDENERMEHASTLYPRPGTRDDYRGHVYLSARGGFGQYLGRSSTFGPGQLRLEERQQIIQDLLTALKTAGLVEQVDTQSEVAGYQIPAASMRWVAGDGTRPFRDPITIPNEPEGGGRTNPYFVNYYRGIALETQGLRAHEHTAQVQYEDRVQREQDFREARLPILYCSPTMELGIDIAELNVVNMRNVPPTPANYAQRSGRAGRSGQPALVFTYCSTGSTHDQYFFKRPERMVSGAVTPPRLDLANEDLIRAHVQAMWLAESNLDLGSSLRDVVDVEGVTPSLNLLAHVADTVQAVAPRERALAHARRVFETLDFQLEEADWYSADWLDQTINKVPLSFQDACERWRGLYRSAYEQARTQSQIVVDASRSAEDKNRAKRLRREAEAQLELLTQATGVLQSDFYSYRYFASEGFLPGYSFPRLPLSAYIPGRRTRDEFISRPRFLAISEFGPRAFVYHEGSRYIINQVIMAPREEGGTVTRQAKCCEACGYLHPLAGNDGPDLCERCNQLLRQPLRSLFRLQNVATKRRDKINSDEEERQRLGYELRTVVRFETRDDRISQRRAVVADVSGDPLAELSYAQAATLWRINLGWRRRKNANQYGFLLDTERGYWASRSDAPEDDPEDPMSQMRERVVPYVEDRRNSLLFEPTTPLDKENMASLAAALETAIQATFQLEDSELRAEPLPDRDNRTLLLFYEAAEGGAGVLRRLLDDTAALSRVAREALTICHFDPDTGEDQRRSPGMEEDCETACYNCLMSYTNQPDHELLDRHKVRDWLLQLRDASVQTAPAAQLTRPEHLQQLLNQCGSGLEKDWVQFLEEHNLRLPSRAQRYLEACSTRPDFIYEREHAVIYVDGPPHDYPERQLRDQDQTACLEDQGYEVIRFHHRDNWEEIVARHPHVFGGKR
jgi:ATP-dependent helicase YprA (DUF1998 family)/very-short-patch-repair endonuclease